MITTLKTYYGWSLIYGKRNRPTTPFFPPPVCPPNDLDTQTLTTRFPLTTPRAVPLTPSEPKAAEA